MSKQPPFTASTSHRLPSSDFAPFDRTSTYSGQKTLLNTMDKDCEAYCCRKRRAPLQARQPPTTLKTVRVILCTLPACVHLQRLQSAIKDSICLSLFLLNGHSLAARTKTRLDSGIHAKLNKIFKQFKLRNHKRLL